MGPDARRHSSTREELALLVVAAALSVCGLGCSAAKDRAPPAADCTELRCSDASPPGTGGSTGGAPNATGGSAGSMGGREATGGAAGGRTVSGNVRIYTDSSFDGTAAFAAAGIVGLTGSRRATGTFATGQWSVSGAEATGPLWADLHATVDAQDALDTLQIIEGTASTADLVFAARSSFDAVVTGLSSVQSLNPDRAQIVLRFVNGSGQPVSGVVVTQPSGTIAYDAGSSYTDQKGAPFGATQQRGMAIILNYTAVSFPGGPLTVQYLKPGDTKGTDVEIRAANGAVTFRTVVAN